VLVHSFGDLPAAINNASRVTRVNSSVLLCPLLLCATLPSYNLLC